MHIIKEFGGLDVPHLPSEINAIQIQRLLTASVYTDWMNYAFYWFQNIGGLYRLGIRAFGAANWEPSARLVAVLPSFYCHLLKVWQKCRGTRKPVKPRFYEEACAKALWGNTLITDEHNRPLYYPSLARSGYITVPDFHSKPRPPSNTMSHSVYSALDRAIPQHWRTLPKAPCCFQNKWMRELHIFMNGGSSTSIQDVSTKIAYQHFKASFTGNPLCYERWNAIMSISEMQWKELWSIPTVHSMTSYQQDKFWKMLHKVLSTQNKLFICGLSDDKICLACNKRKDTFDHVFTDCSNWQDTLRTTQNIFVNMV